MSLLDRNVFGFELVEKDVGVTRDQLYEPVKQWPDIPRPYPPDRVLVMVHKGIAVLLCHVGHGADYWMEDIGGNGNEFLESLDAAWPEGDGLWVFEGNVHGSQSYWGEYDCWFSGEFRELNDEELAAWKADGEVEWFWNEEVNELDQLRPCRHCGHSLKDHKQTGWRESPTRVAVVHPNFKGSRKLSTSLVEARYANPHFGPPRCPEQPDSEES